MQTQLTERPSVVPPSPEPGSASDSAATLILGRYRLAARLAVGGTAEVWRAMDEILDRPVAVKLLHAHLVADERACERLAAEARAVGALAHPAIARVYDIDVESERPALVLELVDGRSLARRLDDGPMPPRRAAMIGTEIAAALAHAHERGMVHRDVKPGNVLIDPWGHAHLVDFGIAQALAAGGERLTSTGTIAGTLPYMAPEQLADGPVGPWTDLYALGVVLYQALTGQLPFGSVAPLALARQQAAGPPALRGVAPALAAVVRACLAHRPADRPRSAALVATALHAWLAGDSRPALAMAPFPTGAAGRLARDARRLSRWRWHGRSVAAAVAASAVAGILAFSIATGGAAPVAAPVLRTTPVEATVVPAPVVVGAADGTVVVAEPDAVVVAEPDGVVAQREESVFAAPAAANPRDAGRTRRDGEHRPGHGKLREKDRGRGEAARAGHDHAHDGRGGHGRDHGGARGSGAEQQAEQT